MMAFKKNIQKNGSSVELHEFHCNAALNMQEKYSICATQMDERADGYSGS